MTLQKFADETSRGTPTPGGGPATSFAASLAASLGTMVANISADKKGWEDRRNEFLDYAGKGQLIKQQLLELVDEDTLAYNRLLDSYRLPKSTAQEKDIRHKAIQQSNIPVIEIPLKIMQLSLDSFYIIRAMAETGAPNAISDTGVAAILARAAIQGAFLNVQFNAAVYPDKNYAKEKIIEGNKIITKALELEKLILVIVQKKIEDRK